VIRLQWIPLTLTLLCLDPAYAGNVKVQAGQGANFAAYHTYRWLPTKALTRSGIVEGDPTITPVIKGAINRALQQRGFREVEGQADIEVATLAFKEAVPQVEDIFFAGAVNWGFGTPILTTGRYNHEGTLLVNLIDTATKTSAWAAMATGTYDKPSQLEGKVNKAVTAMFKKYPKR